MKHTHTLKTLLVQMLAAVALLILFGSSANAQKVYVGVADQWNELIDHGDQWQYVRQNADGFYLNFIEMNWVAKNERGMNQDRLNKTAALFIHKNAYSNGRKAHSLQAWDISPMPFLRSRNSFRRHDIPALRV